KDCWKHFNAKSAVIAPIRHYEQNWSSRYEVGGTPGSQAGLSILQAAIPQWAEDAPGLHGSRMGPAWHLPGSRRFAPLQSQSRSFERLFLGPASHLESGSRPDE
ncbi:MAG TPA: hypothetical protein VLX61_04470, partial [Anaerolineales bacterium]|nr:hypothetical protein [Anaerolineales bacterium]